MKWRGVTVLVTGGASFIGSHLTDALVARGAAVRVVDDLSSGKKENIQSHIKNRSIEFIKADLIGPSVAKKAVQDVTYVFHLAAAHGGRGYIDTHQAVMANNIRMDMQLIDAAYKAGVGKFIFASSGCVYPNYLQTNPKKRLYLKEKMVGPPYDPDNMYGWAKLTTEHTLRAYAKDFKFKSASCRFFSVYGPRAVENSAIIALIAKAYIHQNPYEVWGDGTQIRNWTYVSDIVEGTIRAAEIIDDGQAVNLGTMERIRVDDAVRKILAASNFHPRITFKPDMPTGPKNRVCDNARARKLLGWEPRMLFRDGIRKTIEWYFAAKTPALARRHLTRWFLERT